MPGRITDEEGNVTGREAVGNGIGQFRVRKREKGKK